VTADNPQRSIAIVMLIGYRIGLSPREGFHSK